MTLFPSPACTQCSVFIINNYTLKLLSARTPSTLVPREGTDWAGRDWAAEQERLCEVSTPSILTVAEGDSDMT